MKNCIKCENETYCETCSDEYYAQLNQNNRNCQSDCNDNFFKLIDTNECSDDC